MNILNQRFFTYAEAQEVYGVSRMTLNRLVARGAIEAYRPGRKTLLDAVSLDRWFRSTKVQVKPVRGRRKGAPRL
jgi:excisionase family DNA binding protein